MEHHVQFVVLGTGDWGIESFFRMAALEYPGRVFANLMYSAELASQLYAGADLLLMPSIAEPCGLSQMIAMRYGTVPSSASPAASRTAYPPTTPPPAPAWASPSAALPPVTCWVPSTVGWKCTKTTAPTGRR